MFIIVTIGWVMTGPVCAQKTVTLSTLDWPPYIGQELENNGYVNEIVVEAFKRAGYTAEVNFYPWARALHLALSGAHDGLFPEYFDPTERDHQIVFSDPFPGGPVGLYKRKDSAISYTVDPQKDQTRALEGLKQYSFGIVRGYINTKAFDEAGFLKKDMAVGDKMNLEKLYNKRIDLIFIDKFVAKYIIVKEFPWYIDELEFMEPPLEVKPLYIAFSKKAPGYKEKLKAFNTGLKEIKGDGTLKKIMQKHGF